MKNIYFIILCSFITCMVMRVQAQPGHLKPEGFVSPDGMFEQVFDRFGNQYTLEDIRIKKEPDKVKKGTDLYKEQTTYPPVYLLCTSGYFNVYFEDGSGFELSTPAHLARRAVICQLFSDVSAFIVPVNPATKVNIWVRDINYIVPGAGSTGVLGLATAFYTVPSITPASSGIVEGEIWKTINTGRDAYTNVTTPLITQGMLPGSGAFYHGMMAFNFGSPFINWHTNLGAATAGSDYDLYSVALHEITHALGFASLINYNGLSKFGTSYNFYSRYDLFLQTQTGQPLITPAAPSCSLYDYAFNPSLSTSVLSPNPATCFGTVPYPGSLDNTVCGTAVHFTGTVNQAVYTPDCFEPPSSLSHLEDQCHSPSAYPNNTYYCMSNANGPGLSFMKRYLKDEERAVLCDIGYRVTNAYGNTLHPANNYSYGGSTCPGLDVGGVNDGITGTGAYTWTTTVSSTATLSGATILGNDHNATDFECLEVINGLGSLSATSGNIFSSITFTAGAAAGTVLLRYIPVNSSTGNRGNITYLYVRINSAGCAALPCNMVMNNGFESGTNCGLPGMPDYPSIDCWSYLNLSADYYVRSCIPPSNPDVTIPTGPVICSPASDTWSGGSTNNAVVGIGWYNGLPTGWYNGESMQTTLASPIMPNVPYTLSFWAKSCRSSSASAFAFSGVNNIMFRADVSTLAPTLTTPFTSMGQYLADVDVPDDLAWHHYTFTFTYTGATPLSNLMFGNTGYGAGWVASYAFIDDVVITPSTLTATFDPPDALCGGATIADLSAYVFPAPSPGSSFSGPGVSSGPVYSFAVTVPGTYIITYNFVNSAGCSMSIPAVIRVSSAAPPVVSISASPGTTVCAGSPVTLTASGADTYAWSPPQPCTGPCAMVVVTPMLATGSYIVTGTDTTGCQDTASIVINTISCGNTMTYEMPDDVKHYTTKAVPQSADESVMAGTVFHSPAGGTPHFMRLDMNGNILVSQEYPSPYPDVRVVDVQCLRTSTATNLWYMVCLARGGGQDKIKVICVDNNGTIIDQKVYLSSIPGFALYPMHSTVWSDPATGINRLYICGYTTSGPPTPYPLMPNYNTPKSAFVLGLDLIPGPGHLFPLHSARYDWNWIVSPTLPPPALDYDIAMRIAVVQNTNQLFVTGSVNGLRCTPSPSCPGCPLEPDRSATMNLVIDPTTALLSVVSDKPFMKYLAWDDNHGPQDYGVDLIQLHNAWYILGNAADIGPTTWHPTATGDMYPRRDKIFFVQEVNGNTFAPVTRWTFHNLEKHWASHAIVTGPTKATIATLISSPYMTCAPTWHVPAHDNVEVDLVSVDFNVPPGIAPTTHSTGPNRIYLTSTGTGDPASTPNSFYDMGGAFSLTDYSPTFAALGQNQYMVNAPKYMNGRLNLKFFNPDPLLNISCGPTWDANQPGCTVAEPISYLTQDVFQMAPTSVTNSVFPVAIDPSGLPSFAGAYLIPAPVACLDQLGNPSYKRGNTSLPDPMVAEGNTKLYPNPTSDKVTLELAKDIAADVRVTVRMQNVLGQDMGEIYKGSAVHKADIALPSLKPGVYMVEVYANNNLLLKQKLMIQ